MEGERKTIFCEIGFWNRFSKTIHDCFEHGPDESSVNRITTWNRFYNFMGHSNIQLDCGEKAFSEYYQSDGFLRTLWKKSVNGECGLDCVEKDFPRIGSDSFNTQQMEGSSYLDAVYLTENPQDESAGKWGVLNIHPKNIWLSEYLFNDNGPAMKRSAITDWHIIKDSITHYHNALVIVDNYIYHNIKSNLLAILDDLMPKSLDVSYYVSLFTTSKIMDVAKERENLYSKLKELRPNLDVKLEVFDSMNYFHDRTIISNNIWIGSGAGFDLIKDNNYQKKPTKDTTVSIVFPLIQNDIMWAKGAYHNLITNAKKCLRDTGKATENRLLK